MAILLRVIAVCAMTRDLIHTLVTFQISLLFIWSVSPSSSSCQVLACSENYPKDWPVPVSSLWFFSLFLHLFISSAVFSLCYWFSNVCSDILASLWPHSVYHGSKGNPCCLDQITLLCFPWGCSTHTEPPNCLFWWNWLIIQGKLPFLLVKWMDFCLFFPKVN